MAKFGSSKFIIPYLYHIWQFRFVLLIMFNISEIPENNIWGQRFFQKKCELTYYKFLNSKLHHGYFSANIKVF